MIEMKIFNVIFVSETKLGVNIPANFAKNNNYNVYRRDRDSRDGGLLIFVDKSIRIIIDVIIHNSVDCANLIQNTEVIGCPFSDHKFICANLCNNIDNAIKADLCGRNLNKAYIDKIIEQINICNFDDALKKENISTML